MRCTPVRYAEIQGGGGPAALDACRSVYNVYFPLGVLSDME